MKLQGTGLIVVIIIVAAILITPLSFGTVEYGHVGFVKRFGNLQPTQLGPGLHMIIPGIDSIVQVDLRVGKVEADATAASKDTQKVHAKIVVNYIVDRNNAYELLTTVGPDFEDKVIHPSIQESLKKVTAKYTATDLLDKRDIVAQQTFDASAQKLMKYALNVRDVNIVDFDFSDDFNKAIESKQAAQQMVFKAENDLKRVQIEAQQQIEQARAEAESLRLKKLEITPELVNLKRIEIQQKAIEKWDGKLPSVTGGTTPFIDVSSMK